MKFVELFEHTHRNEGHGSETSIGPPEVCPVHHSCGHLRVRRGEEARDRRVRDPFR